MKQWKKIGKQMKWAEWQTSISFRRKPNSATIVFSFQKNTEPRKDRISDFRGNRKNGTPTVGLFVCSKASSYLPSCFESAVRMFQRNPNIQWHEVRPSQCFLDAEAIAGTTQGHTMYQGPKRGL